MGGSGVGATAGIPKATTAKTHSRYSLRSRQANIQTHIKHTHTMRLTEQQAKNLALKKQEYESKSKVSRKRTMAEIVLDVIDENPERWWFTWELMGPTKFGWLSHATHATLRVLEQDDRIIKDYIGKYVVYTSKGNREVKQIVLPIKQLVYRIENSPSAKLVSVPETGLEEFLKRNPGAIKL